MTKMHPKQRAAYELAQSHDGLREIVGREHNQTIIDWFAAVGHDWVKDDETAWCASFVGAMLEEAGLDSTKALNARSYNEWGVRVDPEDAQPGDIITFWRGSKDGWKGHVGFYVGKAGSDYRVLGGNQGNAVNISVYPGRRLLQIRRMPAPASASDVSTKPKQSFIEVLISILGGLFRAKERRAPDDE